MEFHIFKVGSRYWIFKKSKLGGVLTKPKAWIGSAIDSIFCRIVSILGLY